MLDDLRGQMARATYDLWLKESCLLRVEQEGWVVGVSTPFAIPWLEHRLKRVIQRAMVAQGIAAHVRFEVVEGSPGSTLCCVRKRSEGGQGLGEC